MNPFEVRSRLESLFPLNATCWSQATQELMDMCRWAREQLNLGEEFALNFRNIQTPAEWNSKGIGKIISFYEMMSDEERQAWRSRVRHAWSAEDGSTIF